ncbi:MAG: hypothetical protein ACOYL6_10495 [Bacteriovoracaceae bacterium]
MIRKNVAGMSIGGGRKENFFFCLLEFYPDTGRWFLSQVNQLKDEDVDGDEAIKSWVHEFSLKDLILDFPLSQPACSSCTLICPGLQACPVDSVVNVRKRMNELLSVDSKMLEENPKKYEQERNKNEEIDFFKNEFLKESHHPMMSKSFKRKLKKGFLPYWNRPVDFWVWKHYYDPLLNIFKASYDSFGNASLMLLARFNYLNRHFPKDLCLWESNVLLTLLELYRGGLITKIHLQDLTIMDEAVSSRHHIVKVIEKKLNVFMYDKDLELIITNPRAFDSFLLAITGKQMVDQKTHTIPGWALEGNPRFVVPKF